MLERLLPLLPHELGTGPMIAVLCAAALGLMLWAAGARYSRGLVALGAVAVGGIVGMNINQWVAVPLAPWATATAGALVLGISGFVFQRGWIALELGLVLAIACGLGLWIYFYDPAWAWPAVESTASLVDLSVAFWNSTPEAFRQYAQFAVPAAGITGVAGGWVWPRMGKLALYSLGGMMLALVMAMCAVKSYAPQWFAMAPEGLNRQLMGFAGLVLTGILIQYWLVFRHRKPGATGDSIILC